MAIRAVLIANRGEIVSRVARTARRMGLATVAVYEDADADGRWLRDVDRAIALGPAGDSSRYLDAEALVAAALTAGADAVHPGYGFLAENADFAARCIAAGLTWIGPPPDVIAAMGLKIAAKAAARAAGVPVLESVEVGDDLDAALAATAGLALPVLVKPSAGGGGKGMRRVDERDALPEALAAARREAISAFGDGTLFVERYLEHPRHVEVQLLADHHGAVIHLGERDCSLQRRHQKIVEEAPAPGLSDAVRARLTGSAVDLARAIGYRNAGTAEFLVHDDEIAFLELNTRLQVEHAVTEEVTGLDLVELQLRIADGEPLPLGQDDVTLSGHAIEVRLYAEDPRHGFMPSPGRVERFDTANLPGVRWESAVATGAQVSPRYDPMIAKVIARAADRSAAIGLLRAELRGLRVHGVRTNRELLVTLLGCDELRAGTATTDLIDERPDLAAPVGDRTLSRFCAVAATLAAALGHHDRTTVHRFAPPGWRNLRSADPAARFRDEDGAAIDVRVHMLRDGGWAVVVDDEQAGARVRMQERGRIELELDGLRRRCLIGEHAGHVMVDTPDGSVRLEVVADEGADAEAGVAANALAPVPGLVVSVAVAPGDAVEAGATLVVIEAMKMEHQIAALGAGVVRRVAVSPGQSVDYQQLLVEIGEPDAA